ncbi:dihydrodipicolinate reductase [Pedobacter sp. HMWF019]|uniref:dihydrodipicolinate reductase C-terminal domain-containing protein n=1 Tax=Pedobacter sp. HMWF019 TaxID=2056856 RepID=UPI000D3D8B76|nr:dihydrodipicolinate reductase C-terminal domain-containing protein [Pedobacter sp. HMWF019]PTS99025.1 dihydrodipicolinate reductase [Pedobacter sp. HMWF019]
MKIFIVGSGKLANAILKADLSFASCEVIKWEPLYQTLNERAILVHAGSGRELKECLAFCAGTKSVFIELSTGLETENLDPEFPLIICPNTSILILKTLRMIDLFGGSFEDYEISITESHQSTKKTEPGTAYNLANSLKVPHNKVVSIRDPQVQQDKIGIPLEFLNGHAYHKIVIRNCNDEVTIETKVLGHNSYANGVNAIIKTCLNHDLENKRYTVLDLIDRKIL